MVPRDGGFGRDRPHRRAPARGGRHHTVYRITDGDDPDWASWYADWLLALSELPDVLGARPVRSHLVHALVELDRTYTAESPAEHWEDWYAARLADQLES